jgi:oligopeptide/dipeptide ABC transporter ATP-binding protein
MNTDLLVVQNLKKYFPLDHGTFWRAKVQVKAVDDVDLTIHSGETLGLVGESGCGKSTLGRCILRLEEPTSGKIFFEKKDLLACEGQALRRMRREMQMIFQDPFSSLNPRKTVGQIVCEAFENQGLLTKTERAQRVRELLASVGLDANHVNRYPHQFSGGQRQRICAARALALNPKLVVADEPVSALDVSIQAQILNLLVRLQREFHLTYLFISHDLSVIRHFCDRVAVMYLGRIVEIGPGSRVYESPLHPYTEALISAAPVPNPLVKKNRILLAGDVPSPINPPPGCSFHPRCHYHQAICSREAPVLTEKETGHSVACHFPRNWS